MDKEQIAIVIGEKIKQYRLANGWTQQELGAKIGISKNAIGNYEKGFRSPKKNTMFDLANAFNVSIDDLFPPIQKDTPPTASQIQNIYDELEPPRQGKVLNYAKRQLKEQRNEEETKINEVSENIIRLDDYRQTTYRRVTGVVSAGSGSIQDDDLDMEVSFYEDEIPDDYDAIAYVVGNSMEPK
ncbi:putative prophage protein, partial [Streptococcus pneumoniae]|uniref:helix-turn-helix transcriptional regulator n=1 Tax=Streptococcus pneumoniae TaxID=1313 RepID=UPI000669BDCF